MTTGLTGRLAEEMAAAAALPPAAAMTGTPRIDGPSSRRPVAPQHD